MESIPQAIGNDLTTLRWGPELAQSLFRMAVAVVLGGILGYERERDQQAAGLRTHILVTLGSALFVLLIVRAGGAAADMSRVMQGVVTGVGFLGAGSILKRGSENTIHGITTAAGIWMSTAIGMAAGLGRLDVAIGGTAASDASDVAVNPTGTPSGSRAVMTDTPAASRRKARRKASESCTLPSSLYAGRR